MALVNFIIRPEDIADRLETMRAGLAMRKKGVSFDANAARVIGARLDRDPLGYVEFGPYWWAVKDALARHGHPFGTHCDVMVRQAYSGVDDASTFVAGEMFKDIYRGRYFVGANRFDLEGQGIDYVLEDPDMLRRAASAPR